MNFFWSVVAILITFVMNNGLIYFRGTGHLVGGPLPTNTSSGIMAAGGTVATVTLLWPKIFPFIKGFFPAAGVVPVPGVVPAAGGFDFNQILAFYTGSQLEDFAFGVLERAICIPGIAIHFKEITRRVVAWGIPNRYSLSVGWTQGEYAISWPLAAPPNVPKAP
jgi:hypothetical protein